MRDPVFDPEMITRIIRRHRNGRTPEHRDTPVIQREEEDFNYCDHVVEVETLHTNKKELSPFQVLIATPIILLLSCGILILMFLVAVCHIALLPPILIHDWWARRRRVLKKVSPEVHHEE